MTREQALQAYQKKIDALREENAERDERSVQNFMSQGYTRENAEDAVASIYYGGDCVGIDDPLWQEPASE